VIITALITTNSALSDARRADVTSFGVHGNLNLNKRDARDRPGFPYCLPTWTGRSFWSAPFRSGFHHHATLCIAAYGFLVSEREMIPPQDLVTPLGSKNLPFPKVIDPEAPPQRTERRLPNSIATMRRRLIIALVSTLSRCPCCATPVGKGLRRKKL
jgi:hypothetical protein